MMAVMASRSSTLRIAFFHAIKKRRWLYVVASEARRGFSPPTRKRVPIEAHRECERGPSHDVHSWNFILDVPDLSAGLKQKGRGERKIKKPPTAVAVSGLNSNRSLLSS